MSRVPTAVLICLKIHVNTTDNWYQLYMHVYGNSGKYCNTVVQWLALPLYFKKVVGSITGLRPFCEEFACSPCVCVASLQAPFFLSQSKNMHVMWIGNSELSVGVHVNGCFSLPAVTWWLVQGIPNISLCIWICQWALWQILFVDSNLSQCDSATHPSPFLIIDTWPDSTSNCPWGSSSSCRLSLPCIILDVVYFHCVCRCVRLNRLFTVLPAF